MLYNEIYEPGQYVSKFLEIIDVEKFQCIVLLTKAMGSPFIHRRIGASYSVQEWNYINPNGSKGHCFFCSGKTHEHVAIDTTYNTSATTSYVPYNFTTNHT